ncbi:hypothetical protein JCM10556A_04560 [Bacteroides acidifaciens]
MYFIYIPGTIIQAIAQIAYVNGIMCGILINVINETTNPPKPETTTYFAFKTKPDIATPIDTINNSINGIMLYNNSEPLK